MDYEKAYNEALERARAVHTTNVVENKKSTEYIFPELKELENEKIRKELIDFVNANTISNDSRREKYLTWLESKASPNKNVD